MSRSWRQYSESDLISSNDYRLFNYSQIDINNSYRVYNESEIDSERNYKKFIESRLYGLYEWRCWSYSNIESTYDQRKFCYGDVTSDHDNRQYVISSVGGEPGCSFTRHYFTKDGADVYVDDIWKGFIDFDNSETTLSDVALANGDHVIEVRLSKFFWPQTRTTKRFYTTISGGIIEPTASIPDVVDLRYTVQQGGYVIFNFESSWGDTFSDPIFTGFGIWTSLTSPVDISGNPLVTIPYNSSMITYSWLDSPSVSYYIRVAGYYGTLRGVDEEIEVVVDNIAPDSPPNQYLDIAEDEEEAAKVIGYVSSSSSSSSSSFSSSSSSSLSSSSFSSSSSSSYAYSPRKIYFQGSNSGIVVNDSVTWRWGSNYYSQLGDNTTDNKSSPISFISGDHSFNQLVGGYYNMVGLKSDGSAWSWGYNYHGALGDGTVIHRSSPVSVVGNHSFTQVGAYYSSNSLALKEDGSVWTWGYNWDGQLGDDSRTNKSSPVSVVGDHSFIQIAGGSNFVVALKENGTAWSWGNNSYGRLGDDTTINKSSPVSVVGEHSFIQIFSSGGYTIALKANGSVWAWGGNTNGQLGDNTIIHRSSPVSVVGGHSFVRIANLSSASVALKSDGSVWAWGNNNYGQLGNNSIVASSTPVSVVGDHKFIEIIGCYIHTLALEVDGSLWSWGYNGAGQLGDNTIVNKSSPVSVVGDHNFIIG